MSRLTGWLALGVGVVAALCAGYRLSRPDAAAPAEESQRGFVVPVTLATLEKGDLHPRTPLSGTVRAARRAHLGFPTAGIVQSVSALEAETVPVGDPLAQLVSGDQEHEVAAARASLALAERQFELLQAGTRDEEKKRLTAVLEAARAEAELARLEVERGAKLLVDSIISQSEHDARQARYDAANERRAAAEQELAAALAGTRAEDLAIARARVEEAEARLETAQFELSKTFLSAPWAGSIVQRFVSPGDYVSAGDPVFELVDLANLEVHIEIPGRFAAKLGPESRVRLTLGGNSAFELERTLDATIAAADEAARSFRGIVRLGREDDAALGLLRPGMFVNVELFLRPIRDALLVDADAVLASERGNHVVRAVEGERGVVAEIVPVLVTGTADGLAAIEGLGIPLEQGDSIVLVGGDNAFPGAALAPRREGPGGGPGAPPAEEASE